MKRPSNNRDSKPLRAAEALKGRRYLVVLWIMVWNEVHMKETVQVVLDSKLLRAA